jgi:hypothetical protein
MKKIIRLTESELVSLVKRTIMEDNQSFNIKKCDFFSDENMKLIKLKGKEVFNNFKTKKLKFLKSFIEKNNPDSNIVLEIGDKEYLEKNLADINFLLENLDITKTLFEYFKGIERDIREDLDNNFKFQNETLVFFKENGLWSSINKFDDNIKLWRASIFGYYDNDEKFKNIVNQSSSCSRAIENFFTQEYEKFEDFSLTYAEAAFLENITIGFDTSKKIVKITSEKGDNTENDFVNFLIKNFGGVLYNNETKTGNIYVFSSNGGFVDRKGIDLALKRNGTWKKVQVKSNFDEAVMSIPRNGISVFPEFDETTLKKNFKYIYIDGFNQKKVLNFTQTLDNDSV